MGNNRGLPEMITFDARSAFEKLMSQSLGDEEGERCVVALLERYGSLGTIFSEITEQLCRTGDITLSTALLIKLLAYVNSRRITDKFEFGKEHTELELREFIGALFLGLSVETVYLLLLDDEGRVKHVEHISDGTVNASDVVPRKILECAKKRSYKNIIIAHNHPKGNITPSKDDIMTTGRLFNMFAAVGVRLCAHYIVADGEVGRVETDMLYNPDFNF